MSPGERQGLIKREDITLVRERARIEEIVQEHVSLRSAGMGALKGLCPFHEEKTPSFHVRPQLGRYHCFGCGEDGDVISFVQKTSHMSFTEAVEYLAARYSVQLRYEAGAFVRSDSSRTDFGTRQRLIEAHEVAQEFYRENLLAAEAEAARRFLRERGFTRDAAEKFAVGFAPQGWDSLARHLRSRGFTEAELTQAGLVTAGQRGKYDRFRGRLVWPIRDVTGKTIGFGARRLFEDDRGPKYLNTPETPIYKKSQVLYGLDLARKPIGLKRQVVVVEGYTDVMAAHEAGIDTAVASCGTAFGSEHAKIVRRIMGDTSAMAALNLGESGMRALQGAGGEVIFTFDGDEAGKQAALKAFHEDQRFVAQTFVAVDPQGMDPCDIRLHRGDAALREVISMRVPMFEFAIRSALAQVNLSTVEGQVAGLRMAAPVVAQIRDHALRPEYARRLAGWLGLDERTVMRAVHDAVKQGGRDQQPFTRAGADNARGDGAGHAGVAASEGFVDDTGASVFTPVTLRDIVSTKDPVVRLEVQALALILQVPQAFAAETLALIPDDAFQTPALQGVWDCVVASGMSGLVHTGEATARQFLESTLEIAGSTTRPLIAELASIELPVNDPDKLQPLADDIVVRLGEVSLAREYSQTKRELAGLAASDPRHGELTRHLLTLQQRRRALTSMDT